MVHEFYYVINYYDHPPKTGRHKAEVITEAMLYVEKIIAVDTLEVECSIPISSISNIWIGTLSGPVAVPPKPKEEA